MTPSVSNSNLIGNPLCLDFTNTVAWRFGPRRRELLNSYTDMVTWGRHAGILTEETAGQLTKAAGQQPAEAEQVLRRALRLRAALDAIFRSLVQLSAVHAKDLRTLNREAETAYRRLRLVQDGGRLTWTWVDCDRLDSLLGPIVRSAADLLTSPLVGRVRECQAAQCGWLFLDTSKNRSRKWCQMSDCGNRAKARRHHARARRSPGRHP
ncbi:MAG: ABATE domain-containing protein [Acidobacteriota bacterium]